MAEKLTEELLNELLFTKNIDEYICGEDVKDSVSLSDYLNEMLEQKSLNKPEIIKRSMLNSTFAYQIFNGERNPSRDKILQLTLAMELSVKETQRALKHGGVNELYPKYKRDAIIIHCINNQKGIEEIDDALYQFGENTISEE